MEEQKIQVISRAAEILRFLSNTPNGANLSEIADHANLPRSTVHRIVNALSFEGLTSVSRGKRNSIRIGPEIQNLAKSTDPAFHAKLKSLIIQISQSTGETVDLSVLCDNKMLFIDQVVGQHRLQAVSTIGMYFPLTTTANGKAALACMEDTRAERLIATEAKKRGSTKRQIKSIAEEIRKIKEGALAIDDNEHTEGISALGTAFLDRRGDIFAISTPVPSTRFVRTKYKISDAINKSITDLNLDRRILA